MALDSMYELLMHELQDMYHAENQLVHALPRMARASTTPALRKAFEEHLIETEDHVSRLEQVFAELGVAPRGRRCKAMEGMLEDAGELSVRPGHEAVIDSGLISAAQRVEHHEMAAYGSIVTFAELLGERQVATLLRLTLEEEVAAHERLGRLAEEDVYAMAAVAGMEEETGA